MLSINMDDVMNVITSIKSYLIVMAVAIVLAIIIAIAVGKMKASKKKLIRGSAILAAILAIVICLNQILTGPMKTMINLVTGGGTINAATSDAAAELCVKIGDEGIALLENTDDILPLAADAKLNVFGWASINPILGGAGSGGCRHVGPGLDSSGAQCLGLH